MIRAEALTPRDVSAVVKHSWAIAKRPSTPEQLRVDAAEFAVEVLEDFTKTFEPPISFDKALSDLPKRTIRRLGRLITAGDLVEQGSNYRVRQAALKISPQPNEATISKFLK